MTLREWAIEQRRQTDLILAAFVSERLPPAEAIAYMQRLDAEIPYPKLPPEDET